METLLGLRMDREEAEKWAGMMVEWSALTSVVK